MCSCQVTWSASGASSTQPARATTLATNAMSTLARQIEEQYRTLFSHGGRIRPLKSRAGSSVTASPDGRKEHSSRPPRPVSSSRRFDVRSSAVVACTGPLEFCTIMADATPGPILENWRAHSEPFSRRWGRRAKTFPAVIVGFVLVTALIPLWLPLSVLIDLFAPSRWSRLRFMITMQVFLTGEVMGLTIALWFWLLPKGSGLAAKRRNQDRFYGLQWWWGGTFLRVLVRVFELDLKIEGEEAIEDGHILLLCRHASVFDTLVPPALVSQPYGLRLRYAVKQELQLDPCFDLFGQHTPHHFVRRGAGQTDAEVAEMQHLLAEFGPDDGLVIFPEGTRYTPEKRARVLQRLEERGETELLAHAKRLRHTLPPRLEGVLGVLERNDEADIVFCAAMGFEGIRKLPDLLTGVLVGRTIRVAFWRVPLQEVPIEREQRIAWLFERWHHIDDWIDGNLQQDAKASASN